MGWCQITVIVLSALLAREAFAALFRRVWPNRRDKQNESLAEAVHFMVHAIPDLAGRLKKLEEARSAAPTPNTTGNQNT